MSEWQPIETAPKDGTEILVYYEFATVPIVHIARWDDDRFDQWEGERFASKADKIGWWSYVETSVSQHKLDEFNTPTHWMPLPAPPSDDVAVTDRIVPVTVTTKARKA